MSEQLTASFHYYTKDHLGNIRNVIDENGNVEQTTHYYPSGAIMSDISTGQSLQPNKYNGKELDRMHGLDWYDYGARNYDAPILMWDRMDYYAESYYHLSPYLYCMGNPMRFIDPDGRVVIIWYGTEGNVKYFTFSGFHGKKKLKIPNNPFVKDVINAYLYNLKNGGGKEFLMAVHRKEIVYIDDSREFSNGSDYFRVEKTQPTIHWNSELGNITTEGGRQSPATALEHEMDHANDFLSNTTSHKIRRKTIDKNYDNKEERRVITGSERQTAKANGEAIRFNHKGNDYYTEGPTSTRQKK